MRTSTAARLIVLGGVAVVLIGCGGRDQSPAPVDLSPESSLSDSAEPEGAETPTESPLTSPETSTDPAEVDQVTLPDSFLAPTPEGSTVRDVTELGTDVIVEFDVPGEQIDSGEGYRDLLEGAGFTIESEREATSSTGDTGLAFRAVNESFSMQVTTGTDRFDPSQATISCSYTTDPA